MIEPNDTIDINTLQISNMDLIDVGKIEGEIKKCHEAIMSVKSVVDDLEKKINDMEKKIDDKLGGISVALETKIDLKISEIGNKAFESNVVLMEFITDSNNALLETVQGSLLRHSALLAHNATRQQSIPLMTRKNQTEASSAPIETVTGPAFADEEAAEFDPKVECDIDASEPINTIDKLEKFEADLLNPQVFEHYVSTILLSIMTFSM